MNEIKKFHEEMRGKTIVELSHEMNDIFRALERAKKIKKDLQAKYDAIRLTILPSAMDDEGVSTIKVDGVGRVTLTGDVYAYILKVNREKAWQWLRDNKHGDLIQETVNASSLKSMVKSGLKNGEEFPPDLFKITPYSRASITKS